MPGQDKTNGNAEKLIVSQFHNDMDGQKQWASVMVIGATNGGNCVDSVTRNFYHFDHNIDIGRHDGRLELLCVHIHNMTLGEDIDYAQITRATHGVFGEDFSALAPTLFAGDVNLGEGMGDSPFSKEYIHNLFTRNLVHQSLSFVVDDKLGEGVVDCLSKCMTYTVERICIWDISKALKWGKVLMQIITDSTSPWFLARTWQLVRWYGYGYGIW